MERTLQRLVLLSVLMVSFVSAALIYTLTTTLTTQPAVPNIIFTAGDDTTSIGGSIGTNGTTFTASSVYLGVGSNITIQEAVNLTNTDASNAHSITGVEVLSETFGSELNKLSVYAYNGTRYLLISIDGSGTVTYQFSGTLSMPASAEWAVIIEGCYDDGTTSTTDTLSFYIKQSG